MWLDDPSLSALFSCTNGTAHKVQMEMYVRVIYL